MRKLRKNKGLTMIELIITFFVISLILMSSSKAYFHFFKANVRTNQRAVKTALATERLEEWKSVKGENFAPGVSFPIYTPNVNTSTGVVSFSRTIVNIPAVTQLDVDCINNTTVTQAAGYGYSLVTGVYGNPGYGSISNCFYEPAVRTVANQYTPGNVLVALDCPAGVSSTLELTMIDYATRARSQRVLINGIVKASYVATDLVPPDGKLCVIPLTSVDTNTGTITVEIEQTGMINNGSTVVDDMQSSAGSWTRNPASINRNNITTPAGALPYTETDTKCMSVYGPGTSGQYLRRTVNTTSGTIGDTIALWAYLDANEKVWFNTSAGSSNTVTSAISGWQKVSRVTTNASEHNASTPVTINFDKVSNPNTSDTTFINELMVEKANPPNPNVVLSRITLKSLIGFTDPDSTAGAPVPVASHPGYIITSFVEPTDTSAGQAIGWTVKVSVSKVNDLYEPVAISNTINR